MKETVDIEDLHAAILQRDTDSWQINGTVEEGALSSITRALQKRHEDGLCLGHFLGRCIAQEGRFRANLTKDGTVVYDAYVRFGVPGPGFLRFEYLWVTLEPADEGSILVRVARQADMPYRLAMAAPEFQPDDNPWVAA